MSGVAIFPTGTMQPAGTDPVPTSSAIFPSSTVPQRERGGTTGGVYYLVFLGVLLALIILAAALTLRSYRVRMRYRTQTQMAIARGEAPTGWWGDDVWGVPWIGWAPVRQQRERRWMPIPILFDATPVPEKDEVEGNGKAPETDIWDEIMVGPHAAKLMQPLTVHSLLPPEPEPEPNVAAMLPEPPGGRLRTAGVGFRRRMGFEATMQMQPDPPRPVPRPPEATRVLGNGEPVRVAVIVQMPSEDAAGGTDATSALSDDEEIGWRPGMEIGVWEGTIAGGKRMSLSDDEDDDEEQTHTFGQYALPTGPLSPGQLPPFPPVSYNPYNPASTTSTTSTTTPYTAPGVYNPNSPYCRLPHPSHQPLSLNTDGSSGSTLWTPTSAAKASPSPPTTMRPGPSGMEGVPEAPASGAPEPWSPTHAQLDAPLPGDPASQADRRPFAQL